MYATLDKQKCEKKCDVAEAYSNNAMLKLVQLNIRVRDFFGQCILGILKHS